MKSGKKLLAAAVFFAAAGFVFKFALTGYVITAALCWTAAAVFILYAVLLKYRFRKTMYVFSGLLLAGVLLFCIIQGFILKESEENLDKTPDYLIVLGAGLYGETPSPALQSRIDQAAGLLAEYPDAKAVLTGGMGPGEAITEAEAMYRSLTAQGVDADRLIREERATSTRENLVYSRMLIQEDSGGSGGNIAVVSSEFHLCRIKFIAKSLGMEVSTVPAKTPNLPLRINYTIREAFGLANEWVRVHLGLAYNG